MDFKTLNRQKNLWLRGLKTKLGKFIFDKENKNRFTPYAIKNATKVLYLRHDNKVGDMIISTCALRTMKQLAPKAQISVITGPAAKEVIRNNRNVKNIYIYRRSWPAIIKLGLKLRKENYDIYIDMDKEPTIESLLLLRLIKPKFALGFNRQDYGLYNLNHKVDFDYTHITQLHRAVFKELRLLPKKDYEFDARYDIFTDPAAKKAADKFLTKLPLGKKNIILNPFAASSSRCLTFKQVTDAAAALPSANIILIGTPKALAAFTAGKKLPQNVFVPTAQVQALGLHGSLCLINKAWGVITPDTSIVHAACAFDKPLYAIYSDDKSNSAKWAPVGKNCFIFTTCGSFSKFNIKQITDKINEQQ